MSFQCLFKSVACVFKIYIILYPTVGSKLFLIACARNHFCLRYSHKNISSLNLAIVSSRLGFVHPLQDVAPHHCLPFKPGHATHNFFFMPANCEKKTHIEYTRKQRFLMKMTKDWSVVSSLSWGLNSPALSICHFLQLINVSVLLTLQFASPLPPPQVT